MSESQPGIKSLTHDSFSVVVTASGTTARIVLAGAIELRDPGEILNPFWTETDAAFRQMGIKEVDLDLRDLTFMNSSAIMTFVRWLTQMRAHPPEQAYRLTVHYDSNLNWQRTNVSVLCKLAPTRVEVGSAEK